jgi:hypothetical protein
LSIKNLGREFKMKELNRIAIGNYLKEEIECHMISDNDKKESIVEGLENFRFACYLLGETKTNGMIINIIDLISGIEDELFGDKEGYKKAIAIINQWIENNE